ncbi:MAG: thiol reductant ABC exporter subunit CydD [Anaerolineae bacterium]
MKLDRRLLRQVRAVRFALLLSVGLGLLGGVAIVLQAYLLSRVVGQVFLAAGTLVQVAPLLLAFLVLSLLRAGLTWGSELSANAVAGRVKHDLRAQLAGHLLSLGPAYARGERSGELTNTMVEGVEALDAYFRQYLPQLALAALVPLTILFFVFPLDWVSGLVMLLTAPLIPIFMVLIGGLAEGLTKRQWTSLSRMSAHFLDMLQGLTTLKLFSRSREQIRAIAQVSDQFRGTTMGVLRVTFLSALVLEWVATISTAVVAVQIGLRLLYGYLSFEQGFFVLLLAPEFYLPLRLLGARFHAGMQGVAAAQRIYQVLETKPESEPSASTSIPDSTPVLSASEGSPLNLNLDNIHYAYDDGQRPALNGISFALAPGETVALVGPSGAGKSTVAYLLLRFIEADRGSISVDGRPLQDLAPAAWRQQVAWVPQHPHLFHGTIAENICLARPGATLTEVEQAARQAHAHDFVETLPQGYDTVIGERGSRLSGGQAQRIALARAFLKDAPLIILDEATANLDPEIEDLVIGSIERLLQGRTALIIAHRLSTVYRADRILVMDRGCIVEEGSHTSLLQQAGLYRRLVGSYAPWNGAAHSGVPGGQADHPARLVQERAAAIPPDPAPEPMSKGHILRRLLGLAVPYARRMALAALLGFATIASGIGLMTTSGYLISQAALQPSIADLQVAIVGVRAFGLARGVFRYLERYVSHDVTFRLLARLRIWFYAALEPLAPARLMQYRSGDLLARIVADVGTLENFYLRAIAPPVVALLVALLVAILVGSLDPLLAAVLLAFLLLAGAGLPLLTRILGRRPGRRLVRTRAELNSILVDGIQGVADLLAFCQEERHLERVEGLSQELADLQRHMARIGGLQAALSSLLMNLATLAMLVVAIPLIAGGSLDGVDLALLVLAVISSFEAVLPLPQSFQYLENSLEAGRRLFEIVDTTPTIGVPVVGAPPAPAALPDRYSLWVEDLSFSYEPGDAPALDGVSFDLPQGGQVAVVGPSGAGKSTLLHLLLRFWETQQGHIVLGCRELHRYDPEELRRTMAVVSQHTYLFNATVRENLLLARPGAAGTELVRAAEQAQIHDFVQSLPQGYDTWIGEQGLRLSGGQRQRLAIARAILKDAPILLLDEPVANLDALTGRDLMAALQELMVGRTTLIVSHRLAGLEAVSEILVLRAGRVAERGQHHDLMNRGGIYRRMWDLQHQVLADLDANPPTAAGKQSFMSSSQGPLT